jgi:hypothetical protein
MGTALDERPGIFYAAHQDDEAIGMAGAIREYKEAGRPVYLVLLTNGANPLLLNILNGSTECAWHQTHHDFRLTMEQMCWARKMEFVASAGRLGADGIFIVNEGQGLEPSMDYRQLVKCVKQTIKRFERKFPGATHHLMSGSLDLLPAGSASATNLCHQACWDAAMKLRRKISEFRFYRVYIYWKDPADRRSQYQRDLKSEWQVAKRAALDEYKLFCPEAGRYAVGYHSVPQLLDAAASDSKEYLDLLPQSRRRIWGKIKQLIFLDAYKKMETDAS